ncbi:MAG: hypothetical protein ACREIW_01290, partial [Chthoniobacterales bacterium]
MAKKSESSMAERAGGIVAGTLWCFAFHYVQGGPEADRDWDRLPIESRSASFGVRAWWKSREAFARLVRAICAGRKKQTAQDWEAADRGDIKERRRSRPSRFSLDGSEAVA